LGQRQRLSDFAVGCSLPEQAENCQLAVAQPFTCARLREGRWCDRRRGSQTAENLTGDAWLQGRIAAARRAHGFGERVGTNVLEQIAASPGLNRAKDERVVV